ncbi:MAG: site-specific integrase [Cyanobacteriota bacterium]|nr:site-specific integrase [Cyanobacteriota bacterium]
MDHPRNHHAARATVGGIDLALRDVNERLAQSGVALRLERRGERLGLRGPLPNRHGTGPGPVQRIALGQPADAAGLERAQAQLRDVLAQLQRGTFQWEQWGRRAPAAEPRADCGVRTALESFEQAFFKDPRRRRNPAGSRTTWAAAYRPYLRRLAAIAEREGIDLGLPLLKQVLESYPAASRARQQGGLTLAALARHLELPLPDDWSAHSGGYGLHMAQFRQLPSDRQILEAHQRIPNPGWRLAYGLMATYGLRNHEVFFTDLSALAPGGDRVLRVLPTSKTGEHQVWPFQPEWVDHFGLDRLGETPSLLPPVRTDLKRTTLQQVGRRVAEQFRRYELPLNPYDLRHAWAVRTIHIGLPDTVAARMMGHSVAIHTRTYHHWITRRDQQQAVDAALARHQQATGEATGHQSEGFPAASRA